MDLDLKESGKLDKVYFIVFCKDLFQILQAEQNNVLHVILYLSQPLRCVARSTCGIGMIFHNDCNKQFISNINIKHLFKFLLVFDCVFVLLHFIFLQLYIKSLTNHSLVLNNTNCLNFWMKELASLYGLLPPSLFLSECFNHCALQLLSIWVIFREFELNSLFSLW